METATQPVIIKEGGGLGSTGAIVLAVGAAAAIYFAKKWYDQHEKNKSETDLDTPAGAIVLQLKTVFDETPVNDAAYKRVALQITPDIKDQVYKLYRENTGRNLSDDIADHIGTGTQTTTAKQEKINNTSSTILKITQDDKIQFLIGKGSLVRFEAGSKVPIPLYLNPAGIATSVTPTYVLQPSAYQFKVNAVMEVPIDGLKQSEGFRKYFIPYTRTHKTYAAVQIILPMTSPKGVKSYITLWGDARMFRLGKGTAFLKGLGCDCKTNLGLVS